LKFIANILYIEWQEAVQAGISDGTLRGAVHENRSGWSFLTDPEDGRKVLIEFDSLKERYKELVKRFFGGDPYKAVWFEIIRKSAANKPEDISLLTDYKLADGRSLSQAKRDEYLTALKYINLYNYVGKKEAISLGFANRNNFITALSAFIKQEKISLPSAPVKLNAKAKQIREQGPTAIISGKFCNKNSAKLGHDEQQVILALRSKANQLNNVQIRDIYNKLAEEKGFKSVAKDTVRRIVNSNDIIIKSLREGRHTYHNAYNFSIPRERPHALSLWVSDGVVYELFYQKPDGNKTNYYARKVVYVVVDALNDYIVGYSIGDQEDIELAKRAWKDALIKTGYMPNQVKTDNFSRKELKSFFENVGVHFTPSAVGNARDKVVEQVFSQIVVEIPFK
jgi:hypothetical protein